MYDFVRRRSKKYYSKMLGQIDLILFRDALINPPMPSGRKKEFVEEQVLEKAAIQFAAYGFTGTTLADLEATMGIGRQSIYEAFGDKRSLYRTCLEQYRQVVVQPLLKMIQEAPGIEEIAQTVLETARRCALEKPSHCGLILGTLVELQSGEPELAKIGEAMLESIHAELLAGLTQGVGKGTMTQSASPDEMSALLMSSFLGVLALARGRRSIQWVNAAADQSLAAFRKLLAA